MKNLFWTLLIIFLITASASAQSNMIVFGPLEGDEAGILTVHNAEHIGIELWVRTDPGNPVGIVGVAHGLMSEDVIISQRNGMEPEPEYDMPDWESFFVDGPFVHDPDYAYPIPIGWTCEMQVALCVWNPGCSLDTQGEWDLYGTWLMVTNTEIPVEQTYYPFEMGWYPHSGQGTSWAFEVPPGGIIEPEQSYLGLYFEPETGIGEDQSLPARFSLAQNYPNPFNATTTIKYSLPEETKVAIEIYNILGRKVETLIQEKQAAGSRQVVWNAENQPSGVYFYWIKAGEYEESRSCLLLK